MDIDLNSDLGEGAGGDAEILAFVTSANVSCGAHAGDEATIRQALEIARDRGVSVGAHPGYADREHFGRRELDLDEAAVFALCVGQVQFLRHLAEPLGVNIRYLKPHGALYNQAARDERVARPVVAAARHLDLPLLGLPNSWLENVCPDRFIREGFADRRYLSDGSLVPRSRPDAFVTDPDEAVVQAERLLRGHGVRSLCVHGDNPDAVEFVRRLRDALEKKNLTLRAFA